MRVLCELCPKACEIAPGQSGDCRIRVNLDGKLRAVTWGHPCSVHVDPIEKKPLYHFRPGSRILSLATVGCNLHCLNCQNWEISQQNPEEAPPAKRLLPHEVPPLARRTGCGSIAYTYSDPVVFYEYAYDCCVAAHEDELANVLVTAGYVRPKPWKELCQHVDAANIDLKALSDDFYREICGATLKPVQDALVLAKAAGVLVEVTNLVIPTKNDSDEMLTDLCRWIVRNLGKETPLHFSRFFPQYRMKALPPTPAATLDRAAAVARAEGLHHVYVGNILRPGGSDTTCPACGHIVVARRGYEILHYDVADGGRCPACQTEIYGRWE